MCQPDKAEIQLCDVLSKNKLISFRNPEGLRNWKNLITLKVGVEVRLKIRGVVGSLYK